MGAVAKPPHFCLVSEFCEMGNLVRLLRGKDAVDPSVLTPQLMARIARDIAAGLLHLHSEGIIHRDIAARNIMVCSTITLLFHAITLILLCKDGRKLFCVCGVS